MTEGIVRSLADPARLEALHRTGFLDKAGHEAYDRLARMAARLVEAPIAMVTAVGPHRQLIKGCTGLPEPWASSREAPLHDSICLHVVAAGEPLVVPDARRHRHLRHHPAVRRLGVAAYAGVPVRLPDGEVLGAVCAMDVRPRPWSDTDVAVLHDLAGVAADEAALCEASAADAGTAPPRGTAAFELAESLARAAAIREAAPDVHLHQVAELAADVAVALGHDEDTVRRCRLAGLLHDVGKLAIPERILHKKGPLDEDEWLVMRTHPLIGERLISGVAWLAEAVPGVRYHHERWDGGGYPDGLAGEAIPLEARIVAACDAFSAMTAERSYQRGRSFGEALLELERAAGKQLDPAVVQALLEVLVAGRALAA